VTTDIELELSAGSAQGDYLVRVIRAAAGGEPSGTLQLDVNDLLARRDQLEATVLASAVAARRSVPVAEQPVRQVGRQLFEAVFTGPVYGTYRASLGVAQQRGTRLRVVLRLTAPELAALPWEMLFDPETETYLCRQEPLVRHVAAPYTPDPLEVRPPLRILGLVASPRGLPTLDVDTEKRHLAEALAEPVGAGLVDLVWAPEASWQGVHARLLSGEWHVLHFIGHGEYNARTDEGLIALVGADGRADLVEASRLADLLGEAEPKPRLVVLNSCSSGESGVQDLFSGTAAALVRSGISAVAAMQFTVSDSAAIAFARGFYTAIANGRRVDEAARSGRISILGAPGTLEWVTPVLYVRGESTHLFSFTGAPTPRADTSHRSLPPVTQEAPQEDRRRRAELSALYVEARGELRLEHYDTAIDLFDDLLILDPQYSDAADLRELARRGRELAATYDLALDAENTGDWVSAARAYDDIRRVDPAYRDAAARKEACEAHQKVADLQSELRYHAHAGRWQTVLDVDAELARIDPASANVDGLADLARTSLDAVPRAALIERLGRDLRSLERRYARAGTAEEVGKQPPTAAAVKVGRAQAPRRIDTGYWVSEVCWHPDGSRLAVATSSAWARIYDTSGVERLRVKAGTWIAYVHAVAFSRDGTWLATAGGKAARIWHAAKGTQLLEVRHDGEVNAVAFSPDGTQLATGSDDKTARIWDAARGTSGVEVRHDGQVSAVAFSPDGRRLATGSNGDSTARVWDAASGAKLLEVRHDGPVWTVAFSPDGARLATSSSDKTARVWDAASGKTLLEVRHDREVTAAAFSPDGTWLATGSSDKSARIWDMVGNKLLEVRHADLVTAVAFSPDGTRLATGGLDRTAQIWSIG
jgi:tetratricopeptide (TPR) repeat protein